MDHRLTREEIEAILSGRAYLVDVRSDEEVAEKACPTAMHWDVRQMVEGRFPDIPKNLPVFVFCRAGNRSSTAQRLLGGAGFTDAHDIGGLENVPSELW
ncbi:MAG: rhodanese-like domain-containing protein, partial [Candidatus Saccharimonadales bacterium]